MKAYPKAKVVLSVRDPKTWHHSVYSSIFQIGLLLERHPTARFLVDQLDRRRPNTTQMIAAMDSLKMAGCEVSFREAIEGGPAVAEKAFDDWVAEVRRSVPEDRLLVHSAKQGWPPLCQFLGLPVPDTPYPRVNDSASIQRMLGSLWWANCLIFYCLPTSLAVVAAYLYRADLAVGWDLAPLAASLHLSIKSALAVMMKK